MLIKHASRYRLSHHENNVFSPFCIRNQPLQDLRSFSSMSACDGIRLPATPQGHGTVIWKHQVSASIVSDCSSSIGASATLLCLTDQAEESGVWVKERSIVVARGADVRQRRCRRPARVKGHCSHATAEAQSCWVKSIRAKQRWHFSARILALHCLFTRLHVHVRLLKLS